MTAQELLKRQIDDAGFMLSKVFEGITEETADAKQGNLMTPRETAVHLCECYTALEQSTRGEKHNWGTYVAQDRSWAGVQREFAGLRQKASQAALSKGDDDAIVHANEFMVAHDNYHVGQMCAIRLAMDPEWDAYSIYAHS